VLQSISLPVLELFGSLIMWVAIQAKNGLSIQFATCDRHVRAIERSIGPLAWSGEA
jgi:hypothetical protein